MAWQVWSICVHLRGVGKKKKSFIACGLWHSQQSLYRWCLYREREQLGCFWRGQKYSWTQQKLSASLKHSCMSSLTERRLFIARFLFWLSSFLNGLEHAVTNETVPRTYPVPLPINAHNTKHNSGASWGKDVVHSSAGWKNAHCVETHRSHILKQYKDYMYDCGKIRLPVLYGKVNHLSCSKRSLFIPPADCRALNENLFFKSVSQDYIFSLSC